MKIIERFIADTYAVIILLLAIIIIPAILYFAFNQTPLSIFNALIIVPNLAYSWIKNLRQKILFKKSSPSVTANKGPKVLFWILDGCTVQAFLDVARTNVDLKTLFDGGYFAQCTTIFPSLTPAAHATLMTGCYPEKTRIPAFDWVAVTTSYSVTEYREYVRVMPDFKRFLQQVSSSKYRKEFFDGLGDALDLNQRFLSPFVSTIFETMKENRYTESIKEWIHRGADNFFGASVNSMLDDLASNDLIKEKTMMDLLMASYKEASYEFEDIIWGSADAKNLADLMVYWKSGTDTVSHEYGPQSPQLRDEIAEAIGKLADTIKFYQMYTRQPVYVIITADHGQSIITEFSYLADDLKQSLEGKYTVAGRSDLADSRVINTADIIFANNDRAAFFYLFMSPLVKNEARNEIISFLKERRDIDLIFYRNETLHVIQVLDDGSCIESGNIDDFFKDKENVYPHGAERVKGLTGGNTWGEIVISLKEGYSINPDFRPAPGGEKMIHGDHGGLNLIDSVVPLLIWGPTIKANAKDGNWSLFRTVDIAPTVAALFGEEQNVTDGRVLVEILEQG